MLKHRGVCRAAGGEQHQLSRLPIIFHRHGQHVASLIGVANRWEVLRITTTATVVVVPRGTLTKNKSM